MQQIKSALIKFLIRFFALLPLSVLQTIGSFFGRLAWSLKTDISRITVINLKACFPEMKDHDIDTLGRKSLQETCKTVFEVGSVWLQPVQKTLESIKSVHDLADLENIRAQGHGIVVIVPHLGNWEVLNVYFSVHYPLHILYKPPKLKELDEFILKGRSKAETQVYPTNRSGVLSIFKALRKKEVVGILPDQVPPEEAGLISPFFGNNALTMTLVSKLVNKTNARAVCAYARRLEKGQGYEIIIKPAHEELYDKDLQVSVNGLNRTIEESVRENPEQYQWEYKRFKDGTPGSNRFYKNKG